MTEHSEQRKHKRLPIRTNVFVSGESFQRFKTQTMDFSDGGLFIEGKVLSLLKVDTVIQVQSAEGLDNPPVLVARIAWTNRYGAGIQYMLDS
ncbi:PilZ domain-containing protein [Aliikangiella coralliicola]|uniref:PilZ domain-containing protein n=1 Tax=Aliikangiella coralliicola TaxID=2592383 RepID=A0A545UFX3_9GAMM|nr:PilZ domain-containing protein [Aliikangiella coralliicola]TQV88367.1 PilZ domain-containing protein [Aliikangiella coralliicola]